MKGSHDDPNERKIDAQERIADELRKLRILKEYELGVLITPADYAAGQSHGLKAGKRIKIDVDETAEQGDVIWEDGTGLIAE